MRNHYSIESQFCHLYTYKGSEIWIQTQQREDPGHEEESLQAQHIVSKIDGAR